MEIVNISDSPFHELPYRSSGAGGKERKLNLPFYMIEATGLPEHVEAIVVTSDLQGREEDRVSNRLLGEVVAEEIELLVECGVMPMPNVISLSGDLYDRPDLDKLGGTGDVTSVWKTFADKFPYVVGVHGNHDIANQSDLPDNATLLDGGARGVDGLMFGGVSGIIGRIDRNQRKTQEDYLKQLGKVLSKKIDILLLHQSPEGSKPEQIGERAITDMLKNKGRCLVISGHIHWSESLTEIGDNKVLNTDGKVFVIKNDSASKAVTE